MKMPRKYITKVGRSKVIGSKKSDMPNFGYCWWCEKITTNIIRKGSEYYWCHKNCCVGYDSYEIRGGRIAKGRRRIKR